VGAQRSSNVLRTLVGTAEVRSIEKRGSVHSLTADAATNVRRCAANKAEEFNKERRDLLRPASRPSTASRANKWRTFASHVLGASAVEPLESEESVGPKEAANAPSFRPNVRSTSLADLTLHSLLRPLRAFAIKIWRS
jgi:hypothetical protein